jgi:hypothetical protein
MDMFARQLENHRVQGTKLKMLTTLALVLSCTAVTLRAGAPSGVVGTVLRKLATSEYPVREAAIVSLLPDNERANLDRVEQGNEHDLPWTSADKSCYVTFMVEHARAGHVWGRCSLATLVEAKEVLSRWVAALPALDDDRVPSANEPFIHTFLRGRSVAVDLSMKQDDDRWLVGFGLRSGVPRDPKP